jgi:hypothetical protein
LTGIEITLAPSSRALRTAHDCATEPGETLGKVIGRTGDAAIGMPAAPVRGNPRRYPMTALSAATCVVVIPPICAEVKAKPWVEVIAPISVVLST